MIELSGTIIIPLNAQASALPALQYHMSATRREAGCLVFEVTQDRSMPELFHVFERFVDQNAFDRHQ